MYFFLQRLAKLFAPRISAEAAKQKYNLPERVTCDVELSPDGWFIATVPELPGLVTQGKTQDELVAMINDAVLCYFDVTENVKGLVYDRLNLDHTGVQYRGRLETKHA